jgi:Na+/H+ antiporter NhaD/arsenite permease-like protein
MPDGHTVLDLTTTWFGFLALAIFVAAYLLVILEETTELRKSKPVLVAAGLIWALIGLSYTAAGTPDAAKRAAEHTIYEYGELFLFLLVAITYVNTLEERRVFEVLRAKLTNRGLSYRKLFWLTGSFAFVLSGVLDNLTTTLVMGSVVLAVGANSARFVSIACISIVVAANAGGAFTPFGDITTLMVWQKGKVEFFEFFALFVPSLLNWLVPALVMSLAVPKTTPPPVEELVRMKAGGVGVIVIFALTIATAVSFKNFLGLHAARPRHDAGVRIPADLVLLSAAKGQARQQQRHGPQLIQTDRTCGMGHAALFLRHHICGRRAGRHGLPLARQLLPLSELGSNSC